MKVNPMKTVTLAACVPYKLKPKWPEQSPDEYELAECPDCGEKMWIGLKQIAEVEAGRAKPTCMLCAIHKYKCNDSTPIHSLGDNGNNILTEVTMSNTETSNLKDELLGLMESLKPTPELANDAADSFSAEHHDESDTALVKAFKRIIDLEHGVGAAPGDLHDWSRGVLGVSVANAVGFAAHIDKLLEGHDEKKDKFIRILTQAIFAHAPEGVREMMEPAMAQLGSAQAILFLWALFNEGIKQGMIMGWRSHELALLAATSEGKE